MQTDQMSEGYVLEVLRRIRAPVSEIYFHPTCGPRLDEFGANGDDLRTLLCPRIRAAIAARGLQLTNYLRLNT
jgi:hypothetical protein